MTSSQHGPYIQGDTRGTMAGTMGREAARRSKSHKPGLSPDWRLQLASMKLESLVTAHQPRRGEYVLGSCTRVASQSRTNAGANPALRMESQQANEQLRRASGRSEGLRGIHQLKSPL